jgi:hypothetical protein
VKYLLAGTKGAKCLRAGHDVYHDAKAGRFRCRTCELKRYHEHYVPTKPKPETTTERHNPLTRWLKR